MTKIAPQIHVQKSTQNEHGQRIRNPQIKEDKYSNIPKPYLEVAEGMESQFIKHMLSELQKTVEKSKPDSQAEAYYNSLLDNERADIMARTDNSIGIKDMVLDQIYPKYMRRPIANNQAIGQYQNITMQGNHSKTGDTNE